MSTFKLIFVVIIAQFLICRILADLRDPKEISEETFLRHNIAPIAICDEHKPVEPHLKVEECHNMCDLEPQSLGKAKISLFKDSSESEKYFVVMCERWVLSQTFTQTWLFSTVKDRMIKEQVKIDSAECDEKIRSQCPLYDCDIHLPNELSEEYYYASSNTVKKEFIKIIKVPAVIVFVDNDFYIKIAQERLTFKLKDYLGESSLKAYSWSHKETNGCPFEVGISMGCDKWKTGESESYVCGGGRFAFESSGSKPLNKCPTGTRISTEGIIYKEEKGSPSSDYKSQRIALVPDNKLAGDSETLRVLTANSLVHLDSDLCAISCEVAGLELRVSRRRHTLISTGAGYVLLSPKGHGYECAKATQCKVTKPYKFCGDPPRIQIMCNGEYHFWDPRQSFLLLDNGCPAPTFDERFSIHLGSKTYSLDEGLVVDIPSNETDTVRTRGYALTQGSLIKYEDIPDMAVDWTRAKSKQTYHLEINSSKSIDQHSLFNSSIFSPFKNVANWLSNSINNVERALMVFLVLAVCVYMSKPILNYLSVRRLNGRGNYSRQRRDPYEVEML